MSSWAGKAKRDGVSLFCLIVSVVLASTLLPQIEPATTTYPSPGPRPFYWAIQSLDQILPWMPARGGTISLVGLGLLLLAAIGLFYCSWRLTRNRIVSLGSAFLLAAHPLARATLASSAGLGDLLNMACLCWALALAAAPRQRSARFPNQPPLPVSRPLFGLVVLAALTAPNVVLIVFIVFFFDLFFQREAGRPALERNWRGYAPIICVGALMTMIEGIRALISDESPMTLGLDHSERLVAILMPEHASSVWLTLIVGLVIAVGLGLAVLDLLFNLGQRRLMLPWIGFAAVTAGFAWFSALGDNFFTQRSWQGFVGFAFLLPVLAWRVIMSFLPVAHGALPRGRPVESWDEKVGRMGLQPLPDLSNMIPAPDILAWQQDAGGMRLEWQPLEAPAATLARETPYGPELEAALLRLGRDARPNQRPSCDAYFAGSKLFPALDQARSVLALLPSNSAYASAISERIENFILLEQVDEERPGFAELTGMSGIRQFEHDGRRPWPSQSASVDLVVISDVAEQLSSRSLQMVFSEAARILKPEGRLLLRYPAFEKSPEDSNTMPLPTLETFMALASLRIVERLDQAWGYIFELAPGEVS